MKATIKGLFYIWFYDETLEDALNSHSIDGFDSLSWAISEAVDTNEDFDHFKIIDSDLNIIYTSEGSPKEYTYCRSLCLENKFYLRINEEPIRNAINKHSQGYNSLQEAIDEEEAEGKSGTSFEVFNHELKVVHEGKVP